MVGGRRKNISQYVLVYISKLLFFAIPISWMVAFFLMSSWLGKFQSRVSFEFSDYSFLSAVSTLVILTIGTVTSLQLYKRNIVRDIKTK